MRSKARETALAAPAAMSATDAADRARDAVAKQGRGPARSPFIAPQRSTAVSRRGVPDRARCEEDRCATDRAVSYAGCWVETSAATIAPDALKFSKRTPNTGIVKPGNTR
jgi:hypothetical protein